MEPILLTLLRHGRSRADDEQVHEERYDAPLTDIGRRQAKARAQAWLASGARFDRVLASPLSRAAETATIVAAAFGLPVELREAWLERDNGELAGLAVADAKARYPEPAFRGQFEPLGVTGKSAWSLQSRATGAIETIIRHGAGHTLVVAHGGIINAALRTIVGAPAAPDGQGVGFFLGDVGFATVAYQPRTGRWLFVELAPGFEGLVSGERTDSAKE